MMEAPSLLTHGLRTAVRAVRGRRGAHSHAVSGWADARYTPARHDRSIPGLVGQAGRTVGAARADEGLHTQRPRPWRDPEARGGVGKRQSGEARLPGGWRRRRASVVHR